MPLNKINRNTLRQQVYDELKNSIISAEFTPGRPLSIRFLAENMGVSTMPVREALWQLESEKVVVIKSNRSIYVNWLTPEELDEILRIRLNLEGMAVKRACRLRSETALRKIEDIIHEMEAAIHNPTSYFKTNYKFHLSLNKLGESPILLGIIEGLWARVGPYISLQMLDKEIITSTSWPSHKRMFQALVTQDEDDMIDALTEDLRLTAKRLRPLLVQQV